MARSKRLPYIPVQPVDQTAEFAGYQYHLNDAWNGRNTGKKSRLHPLFKDSIYRLVMSNFAWYGLEPEQVNMIEWFLFFEGRCCAVKEDFNLETETADGLYFGRFGSDLPGVDLKWNFYGAPLQASCTGFSDYVARAYDPDHFVLGFDTMATSKNVPIITPLSMYVDALVNELDQSYQAWKIAVETRKLGLVFVAPNERSQKMLTDVLSRLSDNEPFVVTTGDGITGAVPNFAPSGVQSIADYHMNFMNSWGLVMDLLGLENNSQNKKERLVVTEAEMNRSLSRYLAADRLRARKIFADEMNKKFGTNIEVENYLAAMVRETENEANVSGDTGESGEKQEGEGQ